MSGHHSPFRRIVREVSRRRSIVWNARGPGVTTSGLASTLGVAPASVSGMLKKLEEEGYIEHESRGEVKLTRKGLEVGGARVCGAIAWRSGCSPTCSACLGTKSTPKRACSNTRSPTASSSASLKCSATRKRARTGIQFRRSDLSDPVRIGNPLAQVEPGETRDRLRRHRAGAGNSPLSRRRRAATRRGSTRARKGAARRADDGRSRRAYVTRYRSNWRAWSSWRTAPHDDAPSDSAERYRLPLGNFGRRTRDVIVRRRRQYRPRAGRRRAHSGCGAADIINGGAYSRARSCMAACCISA